jgi:carboxypeptidase PM20D1
MVLDEGGAVVNNVFPGVDKPCALIGIAEKGMLNIEYSVTEAGGHSSTPVRNTPIARLSRACIRMEKHPFDFRLRQPARKMLDALARHSSFIYRIVFANLWCFAPILNLITKKSGGELNALLRTTTVFTQMDGSKGMNVIPPYARMVSNHRIIPGETVDGVVSRIKRTVNDEKIEMKILNSTNPSRVSVTDCDAWKALVKATSETWQDAVISPYLMLACSDSRHFSEISDKVYRFSPMELTKEEREMIHGNNERIPISKIAKTVEFYIRLIKNCCNQINRLESRERNNQ